MQGFNMGRYYPPSTDSPPRFNTRESLRSATRRDAATGAQTVRFEMPFAVWCDGCEAAATGAGAPTLIPQGVRFNAEKRKVGMYLSTPVWSFRMRHGACGRTVEIRTDPAAGEYVVFEGGKRRDYGEADKDGLAGVGGEMLTEEERERRRNDAFAALEGKAEDKERSKAERDRIADLRSWRERDWADPYEASRRVRRGFREERKAREKKAAQTEALKDKFGLGMDLLEESEGDRARAGLVDFGTVNGDDVTRKPLFAEDDGQSPYEADSSIKGMTRARRETASSKTKLAKELRGNTRAAMDPFLSEKLRSTGVKPLLGIKRKRAEASDAPGISEGDHDLQQSSEDIQRPSLSAATTTSLGLAGYDSD